MPRIKLVLVCCGCAVGSAVTHVYAQAVSAVPSTTEARIPFVQNGGIYDWQVVNDRTVLIQGQNRQWYKATLLSRCVDLKFAERLGFDANADDSFDKFSSIRTAHRNCPLTSLTETTAPKKKSGKRDAAAPAAVAPAAVAPAAPSAPTPAAVPGSR